MAIEHRVQSPSEEFIDDPSIIFYDPDEKADFVYKAVPFVTQDLDFSYVQPRVDELLPHYSYSTEGSVSSTMLEDVSLLSLIHISEPTRRYAISYAVFCLKKKN